MSIEKDAGNASAKLLLRQDFDNDKDWDDMIDYIMDTFPDKYEDLEEDQIEKLNKRQIAVIILHNLLPNESAQIQPQMLARKWNQLQTQNKRKRENLDIIPFDRRTKEEQLLRTNPDRLPGCFKSNISSVFQGKFQVDSTLYGYSILLPSNEYSKLLARDVAFNTIAELQLDSNGGRIYARIQGSHQTMNNNLIFISSSLANMIPESSSNVFVKYCSGANPLTKIKFRFYGSDLDWNQQKEVLIPQIEQEFGLIPMVSLGELIMLPLGYTIRVEALYSNDMPVFVASLPLAFEERDISYEYEAETPDRVGCYLCGLKGKKKNNLLYCSKECTQIANLMICGNIECNNKATHKCSGCHGIAYCSKKCQYDSWTNTNISHKLVCGHYKRKYDDNGDEERNQRQRPDILPMQMLNRINNPRFIQHYIDQHGLQYIQQNIINAYDGVEGALNQSQLFWFLVQKQISKERIFQNGIDYRRMVLENN